MSKYLSEAEIDRILLEDLPEIDADSEIESENEEGKEECAENRETSVQRHLEDILDEDDRSEEQTDECGPTNVEIQRKWKKKVVATNIPQYQYAEGVCAELFDDCETPTDVFVKVIDDIVEPILCQSNLYATQRNKKLNLRKEEFLTFIGLNFYMGYNTRPAWRDHFSSAADLNNPVVCSAMPRQRFAEILSSLHCNDNQTIPPNCADKLYKLRPVIDALNKTFFKAYNGTREISVDESMIKFKGRSSIKQYMPMKPIKRGYKVWCVADQYGYILQFQIYQGKNKNMPGEFQKFGLGGRVVLDLTKDMWNKGRIVFFDNFFSSLELVEKLKSEATLACGTIRVNRKGLPKNLVDDKKMKRGDCDFRFSDTDIAFFKWCDKRIVNLVSNYHGSETCVVKRTDKNGSKSDVSCPTVLKDYNQYMGGVDRADRLRALYPVDRKSNKWWHRIFWGLMDIAFVNAYIIHGNLFEKQSAKEFRRNVAMGLISRKSTTLGRRKVSMENDPGPSKRRKTQYSVSKDMRLANRGIHWPQFVQNRGRCEVCSKNKIQSRPSTKCSHCQVFLCLNEKKNCFNKFHNIANE